MKTILSIGFLAILFVFTMEVTATAQTTESVTVRVTKQKRAPRSKVTIKLISVIEDSRCPIGTNCIWAGNATIKVKLSFNGKTETVELNTTTGRRGGQIDYWAVNLESLTPAPKSGTTLDPRKYAAKFTIVRIQR